MSPAKAEPVSLDTLLAALHEDRQKAAEILLQLRLKLTTVFESRGFADAPELVDRTLDRAARKAAEGADLHHRPFPFFYGIARLIAFEAHRQQNRRSTQEDRLQEIQSMAPLPGEEPRLVCFRRCLDNLPEVGRELLWSYFDHAQSSRIAHRKQLAEGLAISEVALRLRIHRLRTQLADCLGRCLADETNSTGNDSRE